MASASVVTSTVVPVDRCQGDHRDSEALAAVLRRLPAPSVFQDLAETFRVLSDPGRARLISVLLEAGELCVCELADATGLSETACSHNLRLLRANRLVRYRRQGRKVFYTLDDEHFRLLLAVALDHVGHAQRAPHIDATTDRSTGCAASSA